MAIYVNRQSIAQSTYHVHIKSSGICCKDAEDKKWNTVETENQGGVYAVCVSYYEHSSYSL